MQVDLKFVEILVRESLVLMLTHPTLVYERRVWHLYRSAGSVAVPSPHPGGLWTSALTAGSACTFAPSCHLQEAKVQLIMHVNLP